MRTADYAVDECFFGGCEDVDYIIITCTTFNRFFRDGVQMDAPNTRRQKMYSKWLNEGEFVKTLGSSSEDFESLFGMYESPCIYVMNNEQSADPAR